MFKRYIHILLFTLCFASGYGQELSAPEYFALAKKEAKKNNFEKAAQYCEKALKEEPKNMDIKEFLGKCYMETQRLPLARVTLLEVLKENPKRTDARYYLINIESQTKRYSSAVCYVNELLEVKPYDKSLWMKKIGLYDLIGDNVESERQLKRLYQIFPEDAEVKAMYASTLKESAVKQDKRGEIEYSARQYEQALQVNRKDAESYLNLINVYIKAGNYQLALATAEKGLNALPGNTEITNKKIAVLEQMHEYQKAIDIVKAQQKKGNSAYYNKLLAYLTGEAARYYKNSDPYELYVQLYEKDKTSKEAKDYLLNTSVSRGYYGDAQELLNTELKKDPKSKKLLSKQLYVYENQQNRQGARATIQKLYDSYPNDSDISDKYQYYIFQDAKEQFRDGNYSEALPVFESLTSSTEYGKPANNYIYSIYLEQKAYGKALDHIEKLIAANPNEQDYILKKIDLLADMGDYENAYAMAKNYYDQNKDNLGYRYMLNDISLEYMKYLQEKEDYNTIKSIADELIAADAKNLEAYQYAISSRTYMKQYDEAAAIVEQALQYYPDSKELRLKQAGLYSASGDHKKAVESLLAMEKDYPYNSMIRNSLVEEMMMQAKDKEKNDDDTEAMNIYREVIMLKPSDTLAPVKLASLHIERKEYNEAMQVLDNALKSNKENQNLLYLKGVVYENMDDFKKAKEYQSQYNPPANKVADHKDHMEYLDSRLLKNQISVTYLKATADTLPFNLSVGTLEYSRFAKKDIYVARVNYTGKNSGVGIQGEADWYHKFNNKSSFLANVAVGSQFFPKFRGTLSYYQPFAKTWQAEIGGRYLYLQDNRSLYTGILGIEKTIGDVWLNARGSVITQGDDVYYNVLAQSRFYVRDAKDYLQAMASVGNAPEDLSLDFQINNTLSFPTTMVGAGYFHSVGYKTVFGILGNWYNYHITDDLYMDQYTLLLTVRTKF
ncbi:tetratricopeptide repeat protein [Flavobacterium sp. DG1-102-2]|uniref:tetratricopeptide repeat protein n=1 Tax=Flavobacterium sp. DG1-102-2 TaxID=3081663 RepID=UPI00294947A8|nr:tetratricopeptide repeat protein [Flavobacterium sp. DG1-102-2]MDV6170367.1 tetratricopeptide repeat protein [Flavobacterium sp. DG1-102-2]